MRNHFKSLTIFLLFFLKCEAVDYCKLSCNGEMNTACKYPSCSSPRCSVYKDIPLEAKNHAVDLHNQIRNDFAKEHYAANMMAISWDGDVEYTAQCWANQCSSNPPHDRCGRTEKYKSVGQNMWMGTNVAKTASKIADNAIKSGWYESELPNVPPEGWDKFQSSASGKVIGHCTQVLWAETESIGCGWSSTDTKSDFFYCNYGPAGNYPGLPVFLKGAPASRCPKGLKANSKYPALCGEIRYATAYRLYPNYPLASIGVTLLFVIKSILLSKK